MIAELIFLEISFLMFSHEEEVMSQGAKIIGFNFFDVHSSGDHHGFEQIKLLLFWSLMLEREAKEVQGGRYAFT